MSVALPLALLSALFGGVYLEGAGVPVSQTLAPWLFAAGLLGLLCILAHAVSLPRAHKPYRVPPGRRRPLRPRPAPPAESAPGGAAA